MEEVFFAFKNAKIVEKNSVSSNTLRQHLHLRMIIMYLIKNPIYSPMVIKGGGKKSGKMMYRVYIDVIFAVNFFNGSGGACYVEPAFFLPCRF